MGLQEVVVDFVICTTAGSGVALAVILLSCFGMPRRSTQGLVRTDTKKLS